MDFLYSPRFPHRRSVGANDWNLSSNLGFDVQRTEANSLHQRSTFYTDGRSHVIRAGPDYFDLATL